MEEDLLGNVCPVEKLNFFANSVGSRVVAQRLERFSRDWLRVVGGPTRSYRSDSIHFQWDVQASSYVHHSNDLANSSCIGHFCQRCSHPLSNIALWKIIDAYLLEFG